MSPDRRGSSDIGGSSVATRDFGGGEARLSRLAEKQFLYRSSGGNKYATFFYAQIEESGRRLRFVNAGHNPPYLVPGTEAGMEIIELGAGGPPVGLFPKFQCEEANLELLPGDLMVAYTEGVSEALNAEGEEFGGVAEQHDDVTIVVIKV